MDNFNELDEPIISSSEGKKKIKAETFLWNQEKAARYSGEGKALCIVCNHIHKYMITTTTFVKHLHCHLRILQRLNKFFFLLQNMKCGVICFCQKKWLLELSAFAIKQAFNILKNISSIHFNLVN